MIVVSDTSPLSHLQQIGQFRLLKTLYSKVVIPPSVERELRAAEHMHAALDWSAIDVRTPRNTEQVLALTKELDRGESEASCWR